MNKIELIAIDNNKKYSLMKIAISRKGDVYIINKSAPIHTSIHKDGEGFWTKHKGNIGKPIPTYKGDNVKDFNGAEFIETHSFNPYFIPNLFEEYNRKKCDGIFEVDCKNYYNSLFQVSIARLTREGLSKLKKEWKSLDNKTTYIFKKSHPWVAIKIRDIREIIGNQKWNDIRIKLFKKRNQKFT